MRAAAASVRTSRMIPIAQRGAITVEGRTRPAVQAFAPKAPSGLMTETFSRSFPHPLAFDGSNYASDERLRRSKVLGVGIASPSAKATVPSFRERSYIRLTAPGDTPGSAGVGSLHVDP